MDDLPEREVRKLLDEGKVTSEEAKRLVSAIRQSMPDEDRGVGLAQCGGPGGSAHSALPDTWRPVTPTRIAAKGAGLLVAGGFIGAGLAVGFMGLALLGLGILLLGLAAGIILFPFAMLGRAAANKLRPKGSTPGSESETRRLRELRAIPRRLPRRRRPVDGSRGGNGNSEDAGRR